MPAADRENAAIVKFTADAQALSRLADEAERAKITRIIDLVKEYDRQFGVVRDSVADGGPRRD